MRAAPAARSAPASTASIVEILAVGETEAARLLLARIPDDDVGEAGAVDEHGATARLVVHRDAIGTTQVDAIDRAVDAQRCGALASLDALPAPVLIRRALETAGWSRGARRQRAGRCAARTGTRTGASPVFSIVIDVESASSSVTRIVARKACGQSPRVTSRVARAEERVRGAARILRRLDDLPHRGLEEAVHGQRPHASRTAERSRECRHASARPARTGCSRARNSISTPLARFHDVHLRASAVDLRRGAGEVAQRDPVERPEGGVGRVGSGRRSGGRGWRAVRAGLDARRAGERGRRRAGAGRTRDDRDRSWRSIAGRGPRRHFSRRDDRSPCSRGIPSRRACRSSGATVRTASSSPTGATCCSSTRRKQDSAARCDARWSKSSGVRERPSPSRVDAIIDTVAQRDARNEAFAATSPICRTG